MTDLHRHGSGRWSQSGRRTVCFFLQTEDPLENEIEQALLSKSYRVISTLAFHRTVWSPDYS